MELNWDLPKREEHNFLKMEIEIKKVSFNPRIDKQAFAANLIIEGTKAGHVVSNFNGTHYYPINEKGQSLIEKAEKYCEKLPSKTLSVEGKQQEQKQNLATHIRDLYAAHLENLEQGKYFKKVELLMKQNIVIGEPVKYTRTIKTNAPIDILIKSKTGADQLLATLVQEVVPSLSANEKLLNSNIPEAILKAAGLKEDQFVKQSQEYIMKKTPKRTKGKSI